MPLGVKHIFIKILSFFNRTVQTPFKAIEKLASTFFYLNFTYFYLELYFLFSCILCTFAHCVLLGTGVLHVTGYSVVSPDNCPLRWYSKTHKKLLWTIKVNVTFFFARLLNFADVCILCSGVNAKIADCAPSSDFTGLFKSPKWRDGLYL